MVAAAAGAPTVRAMHPSTTPPATPPAIATTAPHPAPPPAPVTALPGGQHLLAAGTVTDLVHDYGAARISPWLTALPSLVTAAAADWQLTVTGALPAGCASCVLLVQSAPGSPAAGRTAVLKITPDIDRSRRELAAAAEYAATGCGPRVLAAGHDHAAGAYLALLEHLPGPGTLRDTPSPGTRQLRAALRDVLAAVRAAGQQPVTEPLPDLDGMLHARLAQRRTDPDRYGPPATDPQRAHAAAVLTDLRPGIPAGVWVHGDLHPGNLLWTETGRLAVIDANPHHGDPAYDLAVLLLKRRRHTDAHPADMAAAVRDARRLAVLTGHDPDRVLAWMVVETAGRLP